MMQQWMRQHPAATPAGGLLRSRALWRQWARLSKIMGGQTGTRLVLRAEVVEQIQVRHSSDLDWLQDHFRIDFRDSLAPKGVPASQAHREWPLDMRIEDLFEPAHDHLLRERLAQSLSGRSLPTA